jgi:hypothetical protein
MSALSSALDNHTSQPSYGKGENGHTQLNWVSPNSNAEEAFIQLYFQMVRSTNVKESMVFRRKMRHILTECYPSHSPDQHVAKYMYKLIGHTRDIIDGKGERTLSYAGIMEWFGVNPSQAKSLFDSFVYAYDNDSERNGGHQYGSWNDVKYFCNYVFETTKNRNHDMIDYAVQVMAKQIIEDIKSYRAKKPVVSLAIRHMPKQGTNGWLYRKIAMIIYPFHSTATNPISREKAINKAEMEFRKVYTVINRESLKTPQVYMASGEAGHGEWDKLQFGNMTSKTLRNYPKAFNNLTKSGIERSTEDHRIKCAENYKTHMDSVSRGEAKVNGKRCNPYELVKDALVGTPSQTEQARINGQWASKMLEALPLDNIIPIVDSSGSMTCDESRPLHSAIGLGIRISETSRFKNRIMTFSQNPTWIKINDNDTFYQKVRKIDSSEWGMSTNLYRAMELILDSILEANVSPSEVKNTVLAIFSDMQFDQGTSNDTTVSVQIRKMYHEAGMASRFKAPFEPPHILWWNLRTTSGFPEISTKENTTMLSGYSDSLLNAFFGKGPEVLNDYTPRSMIYEILDNDRYQHLENVFNK